MHTLRFIGFFAFLALLSFPARADELRIAYQPSPLYAPLFVAKANHWVEDELAKAKAGDTKVVWSSFIAGPAINESFAAGQQDVGFLGDVPALIAKAAGVDTKVVGLSLRGPKGLGLLVAAQAPFTGPQDLKGRKVAVMKGSWAQHFLALVLEKYGMTISDIELINMPPAEIPSAIVAGTVDAGATWEPYISRFESEKAVRILTDGTGFKSGVQPIVAATSATKTKHALIEAFLRAYARGAAYIRSNPSEAAALTSKEFGLSPELLEKVFARQEFAPPLTNDDVAEFKKTEVYIRRLKLISAPVDVDAWIDRSFASVSEAQ